MSKKDEREELFCLEYIKDLNGTRAAIRAGYTENEAGAAVQASRLLKKPKVMARIATLAAEQKAKLKADADTVLIELSRLATVDISEAFDSMGQLKPLHEIPEQVRRAISGIEVHEIFDGQGEQKSVIGLAKKVKFYDKNKSLELLGKFHKLFTEKHEVTGTLTLADLVTASQNDSKEGEKK